jgi:putative MATE family efflux protein
MADEHKHEEEGEDRRDLTKGPLLGHILRLAGPMALGIVAIMTMNIVDAYFVGQLGTDPLAAMSFTFPVVFFLGSLTMGLGIGVTSVVSRLVGSGNRAQARRVTTDAMALSLVIVALMSVVGYATIDPVFELLGAEDALMPLIREYMSIWYMGAALLVVPMMGNAAIRASGDTTTPAAIMIGVALANIALDPLLIFGVGSWEGWGIRGAAAATVIARVLALVGSTWVLWRREELLTFTPPSWEQALASWKSVLKVGAPAGATRSVVPLTNAVVTALVAGFGTAAVAGFGAATRVDALALVLSNGLSSSLGPLVGQNWGAGEVARIKRAALMTCGAIFAVSVVVYGVLYAFDVEIARAFVGEEDEDAARAAEVLALYLVIAPLGHAFQGSYQSISNALNAIDRPLVAAGLSLGRTVALMIPLTWLGSEFFGLEGIFWGLVISNVVIAAAAAAAFNPVLEGTERE